MPRRTASSFDATLFGTRRSFPDGPWGSWTYSPATDELRLSGNVYVITLDGRSPGTILMRFLDHQLSDDPRVVQSLAIALRDVSRRPEVRELQDERKLLDSLALVQKVFPEFDAFSTPAEPKLAQVS